MLPPCYHSGSWSSICCTWDDYLETKVSHRLCCGIQNYQLHLVCYSQSIARPRLAFESVQALNIRHGLAHICDTEICLPLKARADLSPCGSNGQVLIRAHPVNPSRRNRNHNMVKIEAYKMPRDVPLTEDFACSPSTRKSRQYNCNARLRRGIRLRHCTGVVGFQLRSDW